MRTTRSPRKTRRKGEPTRPEKTKAMRKTSMHRKDIGGNQTTGGKAVPQSLKVGNGITNAAVHKTMLATRDVARLLGIHANTVRRWANEGTLRATRIGSRGDRRFKREDIDRVSG